MPVYTCITTTKTLADDTKAALAAEITKIHSSVTGAPTSFVHVVFQELPATFNPKRFDADEMASLAKLAGMKRNAEAVSARSEARTSAK